jgi:hypothetical protein
MASLPRIVVVGGHGKVSPPLAFFSRFFTHLFHPQISLLFAKLASSSFSVTSLIRDSAQNGDIEAVGATPRLLSIEDASVKELAEAFKGAQGVLFSAGAGGKGGKERTKKVDEEGAIKVRFYFLPSFPFFSQSAHFGFRRFSTLSRLSLNLARSSFLSALSTLAT